MTTRYDALIIGGGPAGATAALLLARAGWSVVVVERKEFPRSKVCGEYLSATNLPLFRELGVAQRFAAEAGPEVRRVGLFAGATVLAAPLSRPACAADGWGRAWTRAQLDTCLLQEAAAAGATVWQPSTVTGLQGSDRGHACEVVAPDGHQRTLLADIVIAAHGSWEPGKLPTQLARRPQRGSDLLGFKAHFRCKNLAHDLMPLVCFAGGYGGMVHCGADCVSFSLCIRRDRLTQIRQTDDDAAGAAVLRYVREACLGVRRTLDGAERLGRWLAAGPIQPGIRLPRRDGYFAIGNAAGEAHPVVAEGISMAMQSAAQLAGMLTSWRQQGGCGLQLPTVQKRYARTWRRSFAGRIRAAAIIANWAMRPWAVRLVAPILRAWPNLLTRGSSWSGKSTIVLPERGSLLLPEKSPA